MSKANLLMALTWYLQHTFKSFVFELSLSKREKRNRARRRMAYGPRWPLQEIAIPNIVWCKKGGVGGGAYVYCAMVVSSYSCAG